MPIRFAPAVMSLFGLALAWRTVSESLDWIDPMASVLSIAAVLFGLVTLGSIVLHLTSRSALIETFHHPQLKILPACLTVGLMLLSGLLAPHLPTFARGLIWVAAVGHLGLLAWLLNGWFAGSTPLEQVTPVWFIPTVGNIVIPIGAVAVGESILGWVGFSIGLILWLALLPIVVFRLIHAAPLPPENEASQLVLVAPPAIGAVAWATLTGGDQLILGVMLLSVASFLALTLVPMMARVMLRSFSPANWSFGFPLAALASGLVLYADALDLIVLAYAGLFVLVSVSLIVMWLLIASARILVKT